jgi:hypothetical protein
MVFFFAAAAGSTGNSKAMAEAVAMTAANSFKRMTSSSNPMGQRSVAGFGSPQQVICREAARITG